MKHLLALLLLASAANAQNVVSGATQPQLAQDPDGGFYCVFIRNGNIELSLSTDGGASWSQPVTAMDAKGQARGGMQRGPRIGVDAKKNIVITAPLCFDEAQLKEKYPKAELWIAASADGGKSFSKPAQVNEEAGSAAESLHQLAVSPGGDAHVVWLDSREGKGNCLFYAKFSAGKVGKNMKISPPVCPCCGPGIGLDGKGNPFVAYRQLSDTSREIFVTISRDAGKGWTPPERVNRVDTKLRDCPMDAPSVAVSGDGKKFAVAWMSNPDGKDKDVFWSMSGGGDVRLPDDAKGVQAHPSAGTDSAGVFYVVWEDARSGKTAVYLMTSEKVMKNQRLSDGDAPATYPSLSAGKSVGVVWERNGGVEFKKLK